MTNFKEHIRKNYEYIILCIVILTIFITGIINKDYYTAIFNAVCGITYTFLAGKGLPICYLFGLSGSGLYCHLSLKNALWGQLLLYICYYIPMQAIGFFQWGKHLKKSKQEIIKVTTDKKELSIIILLTILLSLIFMGVLFYYNDTHPVLDGLTTTLSIVGMYFTVKRAIEQWVVWIIVNALSLLMWSHIAFTGKKVITTVMMWLVYLFLAIYFYIMWKKELNNKQF